MRTMWTLAVVSAGLMSALGANAQDAPNVDAVMDQVAAVGPDALIARVKELKAAEEQLKKESAELRQQADQKDKAAEQMRTRIAAVEKFLNELNVAMNPQPAPAEEATPAAEEAPAEAPAPAPAEEKPAGE
jgi:uncharacterized protein (DUF3084 family)